MCYSVCCRLRRVNLVEGGLETLDVSEALELMRYVLFCMLRS